jgi:hypothetical protein
VAGEALGFDFELSDFFEYFCCGQHVSWIVYSG